MPTSKPSKYYKPPNVIKEVKTSKLEKTKKKY
jgi:hypothetical protein